MIELDLLIYHLFPKEEHGRGLSPFLVFQKLVLLKDKQKVSMGSDKPPF